MNIYKNSRRTIGTYDVKTVIVRMTMLVGNKNFGKYFRVNFDLKWRKNTPISETIDPRRLIFSDMMENAKKC